jgi:hypothetical protein
MKGPLAIRVNNGGIESYTIACLSESEYFGFLPTQFRPIFLRSDHGTRLAGISLSRSNVLIIGGLRGQFAPPTNQTFFRMMDFWCAGRGARNLRLLYAGH